jgi:hypothetical protein
MEQSESRADQGGALVLIGWKEYVDFPDWGIHRVKVKIDTGARTSALDVPSYEVIQTPGGRVARLRLALNRKRPEERFLIEVPILRTVLVCNSSGTREERPLIETTLRLGPVTRRIPLTITNRSGMLFRMILGRNALAGSCVVDVSKKYLLGKKSH